MSGQWEAIVGSSSGEIVEESVVKQQLVGIGIITITGTKLADDAYKVSLQGLSADQCQESRPNFNVVH